MGKRLSEEQIRGYREDGFVCPVAGLTAAEAAFYRARLEAFEAGAGAPLGKLPGLVRAKTHLLFTWMDELVRHPAVLDAVEDLIGPDILVFHLTCLLKEPGDGSFVSWHQDATYFGLEPFEHVTAWVALSDSTVESGCVHVLPGSHAAGQRPHAEGAAANNLLSRGQTIQGAIDDRAAVPLSLRTGEFSLHHTHLLHRSEPNRAADRRIGIGVSYIPTRCRHVGPQRLSAMLVRGADRFDHFDPEPRPGIDFGDAERAFHADACSRFFGFHNAPRAA